MKAALVIRYAMKFMCTHTHTHTHTNTRVQESDVTDLF
jgi:hypothetical protein